MAFASVITPDQARVAGEQNWELILTNWGNAGTLADPDSNRYGSVFPGTTQKNPAPPPATIPVPNVPGQFILPPVVALAIAPDSFIDLVWMYSLAPFIPGTSSNAVSYRRLLSQDRPWLGQLTSPLIFASSPQTFGLFNPSIQNVANQPERQFFDTVRNEAGVTVAFGTALDGGTGNIFIKPRLNVLLYLRDPPASIPKRAPFGDYFVTATLAGDNIMRVWPVMGRRHIRVVITNLGAAATTVRLTGVNFEGFSILGTWQERLLAGPTALAAAATTTFILDTPIANFLVLRTNGVAGQLIIWNCEAID